MSRDTRERPETGSGCYPRRSGVASGEGPDQGVYRQSEAGREAARSVRWAYARARLHLATERRDVMGAEIPRRRQEPQAHPWPVSGHRPQDRARACPQGARQDRGRRRSGSRETDRPSRRTGSGRRPDRGRRRAVHRTACPGELEGGEIGARGRTSVEAGGRRAVAWAADGGHHEARRPQASGRDPRSWITLHRQSHAELAQEAL
jgi:hypothetical protein